MGAWMLCIVIHVRGLIDILFNYGHILQLRSETVAIRRRMNMISGVYDAEIIPGDECDPNFLTFVCMYSGRFRARQHLRSLAPVMNYYG